MSSNTIAQALEEFLKTHRVDSNKKIAHAYDFFSLDKDKDDLEYQSLAHRRRMFYDVRNASNGVEDVTDFVFAQIMKLFGMSSEEKEECEEVSRDLAEGLASVGFPSR